MGALRIDELVNLEINHIEKQGDILLVHIPKTKTKVEKSFVINQEYCSTIQKYMDLRPENCPHCRFFINYLTKTGKCSIQPVGRNKFANMPKQIAKYLNLPDSDLYTGKSKLISSNFILYCTDLV